jgi:DNA repair exonuclease SbcCD ATPase subunit
MELDQILKRVQWIDDERRKDKETITKLENRIMTLEGSLSGANQQVKELNSEINRLSTIVTRMDQYDSNMAQIRLESKKIVDELDKDIKKRADETEKLRRVELKNLDTNIFELRKELEILPKLEKGIQGRVEEESRLGRAIDELRSKIEAFRRSEDDYTRTYRLLEDGRRQDNKRLTDLQGEVAANRKRGDDQRGQIELLNTSLRKVETRLSELLSVETERRDAQVAFLDKQNLVQVERDRTWKDWEARFATVEKQANDVEAQLAKLESTHREAKRSQQDLEELTLRVERRISEMTEIQRLSEDRFRQEWVTFKADDQKRWTNYTLTQEEQRNEVMRQYERLIERITQLEDGLQEEQDMLQQIIEQSEKRLQGLLALSHEWVAAYERTIGRVR